MPALDLLTPYGVRKPTLPPRDFRAVTEAQLAAPVVDDTVFRVEIHFYILLALPIPAPPRPAYPSRAVPLGWW